MGNIKNIIKELIDSKRLEINGSYTTDGDIVNVAGDIKLRGLARIPIKFGVIDGDFNAQFCGLTTLDNMPDVVTKNVSLQSNKLITLLGCTPKIGKDLVLNGNRNLVTLSGCPEFIIGTLDLCNCNVGNLHGIARHVGKDLMLGQNRLGNLGDFPEEVGGSADLTNNFILTIDNITDKVRGDINSDGNPCNAADGIEENRLW